MYTLYGGRRTRAILVEMVLADLGPPFDLIEIDLFGGGLKDPDFLALNPAGRVPALKTPGGEVLYETAAICLWLAETHGATHLVPAPGDPDRARFLSALFHITSELEAAVKRYFFAHRYAGGKDNAGIVRKDAVREMAGIFTTIDARLAAKGPYQLGERYSLADLFLAVWWEYPARAHLPDAPHVAALVERVKARDGAADLFARFPVWRKELYPQEQEA